MDSDLRDRRIKFWGRMLPLVPVGMALAVVLLITLPDMDQCLPNACDTVEIILRTGAIIVASLLQMPFWLWLFYLTRIPFGLTSQL